MESGPLRKISHEHRVEIGRRISAQILETFCDRVLSVFITGSTAKALDRPYSDLEMMAIVKDNVEIPTKYYVYEGLLIQLDYRQESDFLKAAREPSRDWPIAADEYRNRIIMFEQDNWTRRLEEAVKQGAERVTYDALVGRPFGNVYIECDRKCYWVCNSWPWRRCGRSGVVLL